MIGLEGSIQELPYTRLRYRGTHPVAAQRVGSPSGRKARSSSVLPARLRPVVVTSWPPSASAHHRAGRLDGARSCGLRGAAARGEPAGEVSKADLAAVRDGGAENESSTR